MRIQGGFSLQGGFKRGIQGRFREDSGGIRGSFIQSFPGGGSGAPKSRQNAASEEHRGFLILGTGALHPHRLSTEWQCDRAERCATRGGTAYSTTPQQRFNWNSLGMQVGCILSTEDLQGFLYTSMDWGRFGILVWVEFG